MATRYTLAEATPAQSAEQSRSSGDVTRAYWMRFRALGLLFTSAIRYIYKQGSGHRNSNTRTPAPGAL
jgi:hypothetical protein